MPTFKNTKYRCASLPSAAPLVVLAPGRTRVAVCVPQTFCPLFLRQSVQSVRSSPQMVRPLPPRLKYTLVGCHIQAHLFSPPTTQEVQRKRRGTSSSDPLRFQKGQLIGQMLCPSHYSLGCSRRCGCESRTSADGRWAQRRSERTPRWLPSRPLLGWMRVTASTRWTCAA